MKKRTTQGSTPMIVWALFFLFTIPCVFGQFEAENLLLSGCKLVIDQSLNLPTSMCAGDIDGDGDEDLAASIFGSKELVWYENSESGWTRFTIDDEAGGVGTRATDLDGDELADIVLADYSNNRIVWYKNMGGTPIQWQLNLIDENIKNPEWVGVADLDDDQDPDIIATAVGADSLVWYENHGDATEWTCHLIANGIDGPITCIPVDIDHDDTLDVVVNLAFDLRNAIWYKNGDRGKHWTEHVIKSGMTQTMGIDAGDFDQDEDMDLLLLSMDQDKVLLYMNDGSDTVGWTEEVVDAELDGAFTGRFIDLDNDGGMDIVATGRDAGVLVWYRNDGSNPMEKLVIDENINMAWEAIPMNADNNDFPDLVLNQWNATANLILYYNPEGPCTDIITPGAEEPFTINPNPSNGVINLKLDLPGDCSMEVFSATGKRILGTRLNSTNYTLDLSGNPAGIYLVRICKDQAVYTKKLLLN